MHIDLKNEEVKYVRDGVISHKLDKNTMEFVLGLFEYLDDRHVDGY